MYEVIEDITPPWYRRDRVGKESVDSGNYDEGRGHGDNGEDNERGVDGERNGEENITEEIIPEKDDNEVGMVDVENLPNKDPIFNTSSIEANTPSTSDYNNPGSDSQHPGLLPPTVSIALLPNILTPSTTTHTPSSKCTLSPSTCTATP